MTDQNRNALLAGRADRTAQPAEATLIIATIIAITRREWISQEPASSAPEEAALNHPRLAHPLVRYILDSKRSNSWRARAGQQGRKQSPERLADVDCVPRQRRPEPV